MGHLYARTMFTEEVRKLQEEHHSRQQYERLAMQGEKEEPLTEAEIDFIGRRDSFYLATVNSDGWPYVQHRGGPKGFLAVVDRKTLAFADYAGNKQYITTGNLVTSDKASLFLMDYPNQARLKLIGHARAIGLEDDPALTAQVTRVSYRARLERVLVIELVAYDWNCSQHIAPRYTEEEIQGFIRQE